MKITRRERNLLSFLLLISTISLIIVFIIIPLQNSIDNRKTLNSELTQQKSLIDTQLLVGTGLDQKVTQALADVSLEFNKIESPISAEEFEQKILPTLIVNSITIKSWIVNDPVISTPKLPTYEKLGYVYKLRELVDNYHGINTSASSIPVTDSELVLTNVIFSFNSNYTNYARVLDAIINWNSTIYVASSTFNYSTGEAVISIDFYSIEKP
jgi:hypothetical protein